MHRRSGEIAAVKRHAKVYAIIVNDLIDLNPNSRHFKKTVNRKCHSMFCNTNRFPSKRPLPPIEND